MHGVRRSVQLVFRASTIALQRVFDFRTDGRTDTMRENNDQPIRPWPWWVNWTKNIQGRICNTLLQIFFGIGNRPWSWHWIKFKSWNYLLLHIIIRHKNVSLHKTLYIKILAKYSNNIGFSCLKPTNWNFNTDRIWTFCPSGYRVILQYKVFFIYISS